MDFVCLFNLSVISQAGVIEYSAEGGGDYFPTIVSSPYTDWYQDRERKRMLFL